MDHGSVDIGFCELENDFGTKSISDEQHGAILLAGDNKPTYLNAKLLILERRKMPNRKQDRSKFIVYFALKNVFFRTEPEATDRHRQTPLRAHPNNTPKNRRFAAGGSIHPPLARVGLSSAVHHFKILVLGTWRLHLLARPISGFPSRGLQTRFRRCFLMRLTTFAQSRCSPTRVRVYLPLVPVSTVHRQQKSDGVSRLVSGTRH